MSKNIRVWLSLLATAGLLSFAGCGGGNNVEACDGQDGDGDGLVDCADEDCNGQQVGDVTCEFQTEVTCDDGQDNDADGQVDADDPDCQEGAEACDGQDGDGDGLVDCADEDCDGQTTGDGINCEFGTEVTCDDGQDNDADGLTDDEDDDCAA